MSHRIGVVGAGPTAIYTVHALLARKPLPASITIFERQRRAGQGTPFSPNWSDPIMLANIASIEIPPLPESLVDWLKNESDLRLSAYGISREKIDDRAFYSRLVLGEYLAAQFAATVSRGRSMGIEIEVRNQCTATDVIIAGEKIKILFASHDVQDCNEFDYVILATGHQWPADPEVRPGYFSSPWPAAALARIQNCAVGIRGTALSAIDASVTLASQHGEFSNSGEGDIEYRAKPGTKNFSITMFSRKGILPEADFYHPIPYEPLAICTAEAMKELVVNSIAEDFLDTAFGLFRRELLLADAAYAQALDLASLTLEQFCSAYFDRRANSDPFEWARGNLAEAIRDAEQHRTVQWRYAILRMHEVFGLLASHLSDLDFVRFSKTLKPVFVDNYATVPHESIKRLLALHAAEKLFVKKLGNGVRLNTWTSEPGADLLGGEKTIHFPVFIEAIGQQVLSAKDFPFPSLRRQGVIKDVNTDVGVAAKRGVAIDGQYHPLSTIESSHRLFCLSLPFILGQHPFAQGITSSAEMAEVVAEAIQVAESVSGIAGTAPAIESLAD